MNMSKLVFLVNAQQAPKNLSILLQNANPKVKCELSSRSLSFTHHSNQFTTKYKMSNFEMAATTHVANTNLKAVLLPRRISSSSACMSTMRRGVVKGKVSMRCLTVGRGNWWTKRTEAVDQNEEKLVTKVEDIEDQIARDQSSNKTEVTCKPLNMDAIEEITEQVDRIIANYLKQQQKYIILHILKSNLEAFAMNKTDVLGINIDDIGKYIDRENSPINTDIAYSPLNMMAIIQITKNVDSIATVYLTQQQREKFLLILKSNLVAIAINERADSRKELRDQQRMLIAKTAQEREQVPEYIMAPKSSEENHIISFSEGPDLRVYNIVLPDFTSPSKPPEHIEAQEIQQAK